MRHIGRRRLYTIWNGHETFSYNWAQKGKRVWCRLQLGLRHLERKGGRGQGGEGQQGCRFSTVTSTVWEGGRFISSHLTRIVEAAHGSISLYLFLSLLSLHIIYMLEVYESMNWSSPPSGPRLCDPPERPRLCTPPPEGYLVSCTKTLQSTTYEVRSEIRLTSIMMITPRL